MVSKQFYIIAYDISVNKRRREVVKVLERHGVRMNKSVFECFVLPDTYKNIENSISKIIDSKKDVILYYPLCRSCMGKSKNTSRKTISSELVI
ncbi:MAG: CRISPR-associated endonuclease Cas2, partial [Candidatus Paceibacterota bacterium]